MPSSPVKKSSTTPSASLEIENRAARQPELLSFLKGKDNPFDQFVAARKPDANFPRYHVPSVHREIFERLNAVVDRYRLDGAAWDNDLPRSGVLVVKGVRGMGKTHMVHALQHALQSESPRIVVAPTIYEPHRPFIEYLLHQLVRHFQNETDGQSPGTLELLADALARKVLVQAFHGMTEVDWLCLHVGEGSWLWPLLWGGRSTRRLADSKRHIIGGLEQPENRTIQEVAALHEQEPATLRAVALQHVQQTESGHTLAGQIRRGLYTQLVELAFGAPREAVYEFLLDGYTAVEAKTLPSRETLVDELFQALLELCLLARMPVVFGFDALESLFGDPPDEKVCQAFFKGLADVLDSHRGIPFLLFAELGHWEKVRRGMSTYAEQRFQQGVMRVPHYGSLSVIQFPEVSAAQLGEIVAARMKPLLAVLYESEAPDVPAIFPFTPEDLGHIARSDGNQPPLRQALQALRDRYEELVNGQPSAECETARERVSAPPDENLIELMETHWQREQRTAQRRIEAGGLGALADELHVGMVKWLECIIGEGAAIAGGRATEASNATLGAHPTFGQVTLVQWSDDNAHSDIAVGLLLGERGGMPRDLETKLKMLASVPPRFEFLLLLWPRGDDLAAPIEEHLPAATRAIWEQYAKAGITRRVSLRSIAPERLAPWLALPRWLNALAAEKALSPDLVHHFVAERTETLLPLVNPRS